MHDNQSALFFIRSNNELDQISPILYKLGQRNNIDVDVIIKGSISPNDYRVSFVDDYDSIHIYDQTSSGQSGRSISKRLIDYSKEFGRKLPSDIPEKAYRKFISSDMSIIPSYLDINRYGVVAFDWSLAKSSQTQALAERDDIITVVLPHGSGAYRTLIHSQKTYDPFIEDTSHIGKSFNLAQAIDSSSRKLAKHDYLLYPDDNIARVAKRVVDTEKIRVLGSPRFNTEWLDILDDIRDTIQISHNSNLNIVIFLRRIDYFISKKEVINTVELLDLFSDTYTILKEHPRDRLLEPSKFNQHENIQIVKDEITSASLIEWGDLFLTLGSSITIEPIVRQKPVLSLEYAHGNYTNDAYYFEKSDIRSKEHLLHTIQEFLNDGHLSFYDEVEYNKFVEEMVTSNNQPVLDSWAEFIERKTLTVDHN